MNLIRVILPCFFLGLAGQLNALSDEQKNSRREEIKACIDTKAGEDRLKCVNEVIKKYRDLIKAEKAP